MKTSKHVEANANAKSQKRDIPVLFSSKCRTLSKSARCNSNQRIYTSSADHSKIINLQQHKKFQVGTVILAKVREATDRGVESNEKWWKHRPLSQTQTLKWVKRALKDPGKCLDVEQSASRVFHIYRLPQAVTTTIFQLSAGFMYLNFYMQERKYQIIPEIIFTY